MSKITPLQIYTEPIFIEGHSEGWVYRISDKYVVKVPAPDELVKYTTHMFYEIKIARLLYSFGIPVPEPITCDYVNVRDKVEIGYIMEYVEGISWYDKSISKKDNILAHNLLHRELKLTSSLGFSLHNEEAQWILTKDKKIKLIDFTNWKYKGL
jgi:RIO-like serine/threonine protein kinase